MAAKQGLILVDTKYEFGIYEGKVYLIDEIHTPDSSRYFYDDGYQERQQKGEAQKQLSKEFLRQWLIENNFQGLHGQTVPAMNDDIVQMVSDRYIELFEKITGTKFIRHQTENIADRVYKNVAFLKCCKNYLPRRHQDTKLEKIFLRVSLSRCVFVADLIFFLKNYFEFTSE
jgi:phosphoribosylaminoimidazole-succinocarboxamide synthase